MSLAKTHYTAKEIAGFPEMPGTESAVIRRARKEGWQFRDRQGRGGGREYFLKSLPEATRKALLGKMIEGAGVETAPKPQLPPTPSLVKRGSEGALPAISSLKNWQRDCMDARLAFIRLIEQAVAHGMGVKKAMAHIVEKAVNNDLPESVVKMIPVANKRAGKPHSHQSPLIPLYKGGSEAGGFGEGGKRTLSVRSLMRWWSDYQNAGGNYAVLAPKDVEKHEMPAWAPHFLKIYQVPQKISVPYALEIMRRDVAKNTLSRDVACNVSTTLPTIDQAYRFIEKFSKLDIQRGRMSPLSLRNIKGFTRRDTSEFLPLEIVLCDGHSFKARVAHPVHGKPFHPEICWVVDAVTRKALGWSAGLAESAQTVADAVRHTVETNGIPSILYTDKGAGNMAKDNTEIITGLFTRLGITHETGIPGNSQARGRIERAMQSIWIRLAKEYATCTHKSMDKHAARTVYLVTNSDVKKAGRSDLLKSWRQFLDDCQRALDDYNNRSHSELDKIRDAVTGKMRHMTPNECEAGFIARGWERPTVEKEKLDALFRPQMMVTVIRAEVRLFGNRYFAKDLEHYNKERVIVEYNIHDASKVWVNNYEGQRICEALFEGNKKSMFPVTEVELAVENREKRRKALKLQQIEDIEAEGRGVVETYKVPTLIVLSPEVLEYEEREAKKATPGQPQGIAPTVGAGLAPALVMTAKKKKTFIDDYEVWADISEREKTGDASVYEIQWKADWERSQDLCKKVGLIVSDPYCRFEEKGGEVETQSEVG